MLYLKNLELEDKDAIVAFTSQFPPYSDFNFISLWSYNIEKTTQFFLDENSLIIKFPDYLTSTPVYSLLSRENSQGIITDLFEYIKLQNQEPMLNLVPEITLKSGVFNEKDFLITEDRNNFDYILSVHDFSSLSNTSLRSKRRHVHHFMKYYPHVTVKFSNCTDQQEKEQILNLFDSWATKKKSSDTSHEKTALIRLLETASGLNVINISLWDKDQLIGFAITELLEDWAIGNFMKGNTEYQNIYDMLYYQLVLHLKDQNIQYLNYEQDLGIEAMREAKMHLHPDHFLKKHTIIPVTK